jgi:alpha-L-rhamnosidase
MLTPLLLALAMLPGRPAAGQAARAHFVPSDLRCERLLTPLAEETQRPRLSWRLLPADPNVRGIRQTRYRVRVASTEARLASGRGDMWDSGVVSSPQTIGVRYAGEQLLPCRRYAWSVTAWDQSGASATARSWWETGPIDRRAHV